MTSAQKEKVRYMRDRPRTDPYEVLGVAHDADLPTVKRAYRREARKHHPDRNRGDLARAEEQFKVVAEAYEMLSDPERRALFDRYGVDGLRRKAKTSTSAKGVPANLVYVGRSDGADYYYQRPSVPSKGSVTLPGVDRGPRR